MAENDKTTKEMPAISQAKFLCGIVSLHKGLDQILGLAKDSIKQGSNPEDPAPEEWMQAYQKIVKESTSKICDASFTHKEAMGEIASHIAGVIIKSLQKN